MASAPTITTFLFAILVPLTIVAQTTTDPTSARDESTSTAASSRPGISDNFPFKPPQYDLDAIQPHFGAAGFGTRPLRSLEGHSRAKRSVVTCNFLTQGGFRCTGRRTVRRCYQFNIGTITTCGGLFPYCNNGVCSTVKGSLCSSTTSTSSSSTSSTSTTTTTTGRTNSTG